MSRFHGSEARTTRVNSSRSLREWAAGPMQPAMRETVVTAIIPPRGSRLELGLKPHKPLLRA
jgi:hypothetical protein